MTHAFSLEDRVSLIRTPYNSKCDIFRIMALLPHRDGEPQYRIKPDAPGPERVAMQTHLVAARSSVFAS